MTDFLLIDGNEFRPIEGYETRYAVSACDLVYSLSRIDERKRPRGGHYMKTRVCSVHGYVTVKLCAGGGKYRLHKIHLLVLNAFGSRKLFPEAQCRHLDDVKTNNKIENLAWGTSKQNKADSMKNGTAATGARNGGGGKLKDQDVRKIKRLINENKFDQKQIGKMFNVTGVMVGRVASGKSWSHIT